MSVEDKESLIMKDMLNEEFDAADLFVSEDLIARTMAAIKSSEEKADDRVINIENAASKATAQKKRSFKWVKLASGIAAALLVGVVGIAIIKNGGIAVSNKAEDTTALAPMVNYSSNEASPKMDSSEEDITYAPATDICFDDYADYTESATADEEAFQSDVAPAATDSADAAMEGITEYNIADSNEKNVNKYKEGSQTYIAPIGKREDLCQDGPAAEAEPDDGKTASGIQTEEPDGLTDLQNIEISPDRMTALLEMLDITDEFLQDDAKSDLRAQDEMSVYCISSDDNDTYRYIEIYDNKVYYELAENPGEGPMSKWTEYSDGAVSPAKIATIFLFGEK